MIRPTRARPAPRLTVRFDLVARDVTCDDRDEAGEAPGTEHACDRKRDAEIAQGFMARWATGLGYG
jgi:hypothetical protein